MALPESESVAGERVIGAMNLWKSSDLATHSGLHCSWPEPQPSFYHSDPKLRLTAWSKKVKGLGFHPRRQMCNCRGERMVPGMLMGWHHLAQFPLPITWRRDGVRECPKSTSTALLSDLASLCTATKAQTWIRRHQTPEKPRHASLILHSRYLFPFSHK